jgi:hypothetical protein
MRSLQTVAGLKVPARLSSFCCSLAIVGLAWCGGSQPVTAARATVTTLSLTSGGSAVSSVAGGTVVTLTATVQAGATASSARVTAYEPETALWSEGKRGERETSDTGIRAPISSKTTTGVSQIYSLSRGNKSPWRQFAYTEA